MSRDFLALWTGSNRGAPVTDENPVPVKVMSGGGGSISAVATADAPAYAEGESEPLSMTLGGELRVVGTFEPPVGAALEATQLLVKTAVETTATNGATSALQTEGNTALAEIQTASQSAAEDLAAMRIISESGTPTPVFVRSAEYEAVAAGVTDQMCGATGAIGDTIEGVLVIPTSTSPGLVSIEDGSANTVIFDGGSGSVLTLHPFWIPLNGIASVSGGWEITTGANVRAIAFGNFT